LIARMKVSGGFSRNTYDNRALADEPATLIAKEGVCRIPRVQKV
jgi:hypothetical protein